MWQGITGKREQTEIRVGVATSVTQRYSCDGLGIFGTILNPSKRKIHKELEGWKERGVFRILIHTAQVKAIFAVMTLFLPLDVAGKSRFLDP